MKVKEAQVLKYREKLMDYVKNENPDQHDFEPKTYILDMLYFMGKSIDEDRFRGSRGFDEFKQILRDAME